MDNSNYLKPFQGLDPDTMPHADDPNVPSLLSNEDTRPSNPPSIFYFSPSDDSAEVYSYASSSWIQRTAVPAGGQIINMPKCYNPNGAPFEGRAACEENARRLREDQKTRAIENSHPPYWSSAVNYVSGNLSNRNGIIWHALGDNGPDMAAGVRDPISTPNYWRADQNLANNTVIWIDYSATNPGDGLSEARPLRNFTEFMNLLRSVSTGKGPFMSSAVGYTDCPSFYVVVRGSTATVESFAYPLMFENTNIIFDLQISSLLLDTSACIINNSSIKIRSGVASNQFVFRTHSIYCHNSFMNFINIKVRLGQYGVTSAMNLSNSYVLLAQDATLDLSGETYTALGMFASMLDVNGVLICRQYPTASGVYTAVNTIYSVLNFGGTSRFTINSRNGGVSLGLTCSRVHDYGAETYISNIWADNSFCQFLGSGRLQLGNLPGNPASDWGVVLRGTQMFVSNTREIVSESVVPTAKGYINNFSTLEASGRAQASWPGTNAWVIGNQGVYIQ